MDSRFKIPAPAVVKTEDCKEGDDYLIELGAEASAEAHHRTTCQEIPPSLSMVARTGIRHRWVGINVPRCVSEISSRNSAI